MENPFSIFPEELWLMMLPHLDLMEIQRLFQAMPQFCTTLNKLFYILYYTFDSNQFFKKQTRSSFNPDTTTLISRRWCSAVYSFVTNYPLHVGQIKPEFCYLINLDDTCPTLRFNTAEKIRSFHNADNLHTVHFVCPTTLISERQQATFKACAEFLKNYGSSIKILSLDFPQLRLSFSVDEYDACIFPSESFAALKNVHTLSVHFRSIGCWRELLNPPNPPDSFPELPSLQNLEVHDITDNIWGNRYNVLDYFIREYIFKGQVKTLRVISKQELFALEEEFVLDKNYHANADVTGFRNYIRGHNLKQVTVKQKKKLVLYSVLLWLQRTGLNPTEICFDKCPELTTNNDELIQSFPMVKYLKITDYKFLQYRFLSGMTALEHLCLECDNEDHSNMCDYKQSDSLTNAIRCHLYNDKIATEMEVLSKLPSLKTLLILRKDGTCRHFVRCLGNTPVIYTK